MHWWHMQCWPRCWRHHLSFSDIRSERMESISNYIIYNFTIGYKNWQLFLPIGIILLEKPSNWDSSNIHNIDIVCQDHASVSIRSNLIEQIEDCELTNHIKIQVQIWQDKILFYFIIFVAWRGDKWIYYMESKDWCPLISISMPREEKNMFLCFNNIQHPRVFHLIINFI